MKSWQWMLALPALQWGLQANADVSLLGRSSITAMNVTQSSQEQLLLSDRHMRRDTLKQGRAYSYVYDLDSRELTTFDHFLHRAEVRRAQGGDSKGASAQLKLNMKPNGEKRQLGHWECEKHELTASMPVQLGPENAVMHFSGELWVAKGAEERDELKAFSRAVAAHSFWDVPTEAGRPPSADSVGMAEVLKRALKKGPLCGGDVSVRYEGGGAMAQLAGRMGSRVVIHYEKLTTDPVPATAFVIPQGYSTLRY